MISESAKHQIRRWAESEPLVKSAIAFGSRVKGNYRGNSDLDIAVEIFKPPGDVDLQTTWTHDGDELQERANDFVEEYKVHLQLLDGENTPIIYKALAEGAIVIYEG